jgi:hypothetical protein
VAEHGVLPRVGGGPAAAAKNCLLLALVAVMVYGLPTMMMHPSAVESVTSPAQANPMLRISCP